MPGQAIEYACDHVRTNVGGSDLSEKIYKGHYTGSVAEFTKALCEKLSDVRLPTCPQPNRRFLRALVRRGVCGPSPGAAASWQQQEEAAEEAAGEEQDQE